MNSDDHNDNLLDRYLDGLMSQQEADKFLQQVDAEELRKAEKLQAKVDQSLKSMLSGLSVDEEAIKNEYLRNEEENAAELKTAGPQEPTRSSFTKLALAALLLVAAGLSIWFNSQPQQLALKFEPSPLTDIYAKKIENFRPYYVCDDKERFAQTFVSKIGIPLALAKLPTDRSMLGLSYLGGISRNTVAMLSQVQGEDVIVFVDRETEPGVDVGVKSTDPSLNVFVQRKNGLVFVEVTPLESAELIDYFEFLE